MTTRQIESAVQDRTVANYRDCWGTPLGLYQQPRHGGLVVIGCIAGMVAAYALGIFLS
jgi:hypothetical protein